jgi:hypothetical protein
MSSGSLQVTPEYNYDNGDTCNCRYSEVLRLNLQDSKWVFRAREIHLPCMSDFSRVREDFCTFFAKFSTRGILYKSCKFGRAKIA